MQRILHSMQSKREEEKQEEHEDERERDKRTSLLKISYTSYYYNKTKIMCKLQKS